MGVHPNSLANLQPGIKDGNDKRVINGHSAEANRKRSESLKKTHAKKKAIKDSAAVVKELLDQDFPVSLIDKVDIADFLPEDLKESITQRGLMYARIYYKTILEDDLAKAVKGAEFMRNSAGEQPVEKTDISVVAEAGKGVDLMIDAIMKILLLMLMMNLMFTVKTKNNVN